MINLLIKNAVIVDGSGAEPYPAEIAVIDGKVARIAPKITADAEQVIDARKQYVTPGFIDMHRHSDAAVFKDGFGEIELRQGVTTTINGNCGLSIAPCPEKWKTDIFSYLKPIIGSVPKNRRFETFSEYLQVLENKKLPINFGMHVGNGTLRMAAKGFGKGRLIKEEAAAARSYLVDAIQSGAFGVSMGIVYMPENMYDLDGFVEVLEPIRNSKIPLVTHIRGEGDLLVESLEEVIEIARRLNVPLHVSHYKCVGRQNWGHLLAKATELLDRSREQGMQITCDVYPWTAGSTQLVQLLPPEYLEGGMEKTTERLKDPALRRKCREILEVKQTRFENLLASIGWESVMITTVHTEKNRPYVGMRVSEIAKLQGKDPYDCAFDMLVDEDCDVSMVNFIACEEDIATILKYPYSSVISDSIYPDGGIPHPRQYGTYPKLLCDYVRDKSVLTLPEAIHKITNGPAQVLSIPGKGLVKEGYDADLCVFDLKNIKNNATYVSPRGLGTGFSYVLVNGKIANDHDGFLNTGAGRVLRRR